MLGEKKSGDYFTFTDVIQPDKLRKALLTAFVLDMEWLKPHFRADTKLVIVRSYDPNSEHQGVLQSADGMTTIVNPEFGGVKYPIMHSKIMLLFYDNYVRFVASSANLIEIDWTRMQNIVFIQDIRLDVSQVFKPTEFGATLAQALRDLSVPEQVTKQLDHMDMSRFGPDCSHNFSPGAWGRLKRHQLGLAFVNNYEFGVVIPNMHYETVFGHDSVSRRGARIPLPFKLAWTPFAEEDMPCFSD
ncbi:hypothetical protein GGF43_004673 [Coemansia sp. RSA 2618]|nr:hypothetical protein GGF43_004673 [Coemansia sp. RSA 2618]